MAEDAGSTMLSAESLLQHESFVRSVARGILSDEWAAEDVLQETWLTALRRKPRSPSSMRKWLASVARNRARDTLRREERRACREEGAAGAGRSEAVDRAYERLAVQREVVGAILALKEPYKSVVILRYYHDLTSTEIAEHLNAKAPTVRTQLVRAHEILRRELDSRYGGDERWAAMLLSLPKPGSMWPHALVWGGLAVLSGSVLFFAAKPWGAKEPEASSLSARVGENPESVQAEMVVAASAPSTREAVPVSVDEPHGSLTLDLAWWDGTPATDVGVRLIPSGERQPAQSFVWKETDVQGRLHVARIHAGPVTVAVDRLGLMGTVRIEVEAGTDNAKEVEISRGIDVTGLVLDGNGDPVADAQVWAFPDTPYGSAYRVGRSSANGSFFLRSVATGSELCGTSAAHGNSHMIPFEELEETGAYTRRMELRLEAESFTVEGSVVDPDGKAVEGALVHALCRGYRGRGRLPYFLVPTDETGAFRYSGHAVSQLIVDAPGFALGRERVPPYENQRSRVDLVLDRGFSLSGVAVLPDGSPASGASITVDDLHFASRFYNLYTSVDEDGLFLLQQVPPGLANARASVRLDGVRLAANAQRTGKLGETVTWDVAFGSGPTIRGRAVDAEGNPCDGWEVEARSRTPVHRKVVTDAEGGFVILDLLEEPYELRLFAPDDNHNMPRARVGGVLPGPSELELVAVGEVELSSFLTGRLLDSEGDSIRAPQMWARRVDGRGSLNPEWDEENRFRIGPLPAGEYELSISLPDLPSFHVPEISIAQGAELDLGDVVVPEPGAAELIVRREDGEALSEGATVYLIEAGLYAHILSSEDGITFESGPMFPGTYSLKVQAQNAAVEHVHPVVIQAGETTSAELTVAPGRLVRLDFEVPEGERLPRDLTLTVHAEDGTTLLETRRKPQAVGSHEILIVIESLPLGTHTYSAKSNDGWSDQGTLNIEDAEDPLMQVSVSLRR